ncbi:heme-binding protein [Halovenus sp. WSH3]|uniref:Heme-binding protein n=1 Tax=Halovenus carboxidivorans TaxID=2692199 RepID=A0A6B0T7U2_9EURY|nr:heme-binding protein [Halovenus carboxidivorans]MXR51673.1 heme-binding protein [Halovenus carboxidivorans]
MPEARDPPPTDEGWYALHDYRTIDWDAWRDATERERERALAEVTDHLDARLAVEDAEEGDSALYSILGHKADILLLHLRPTSAHIGALERQFEQTEFARFTERETSFVSVTEASGYSEDARDYFEGELDENSGLYNYIQTRLKPTIPDATHVCFYPMDKRRQPGQNWYDLDFEERAEHMEAHGDIGRDYGGKVVQMITGAIALDDWEWGVTLWGDDLVDMKDLLYEMRFDPSTSQFAEFGPFYVGRRIAPDDLPALMAGEVVTADGDIETDLDTAGPIHPGQATADAGHGASESDSARAGDEHAADDGDHDDSGAPPMGGGESVTEQTDDLAGRLGTLGIQAGEEYDEGDFGLLLYSDADAQEIESELGGLRENFEHYDTHVTSVVRAQSGRSAIVSIWDNERAADTAEGFLTDLPGVEDGYRGPLGDSDPQDDGDHGAGDESPHAGGDADSIRDELADLDVYAGQPHGEDIYALVLYSEAPLSELTEEVAELSDGFDRYDTHEGTAVYDDPDSDKAAVVSRWETADAANTASEYLSDLPGIVGWADEGEGFETMGMFYTVKPDYRDTFVERFADVGELLNEMEGHRSTALLENVDNENDMFIASRWDSKDDAMEFFRSEEFTDTVDWGREVLADQPRHVFLA